MVGRPGTGSKRRCPAGVDRTRRDDDTDVIADLGCLRAEDVDAEITQWDGAAGSRIATIEITNVGGRSCTVPSLARLQLVDGAGTVLIDGAEPTHATFLTMDPDAVLTTLVEASNYCGRAASPRVTVDFLLGKELLYVATPLTESDGSLPPCNGPGSPGSIQMQPWSPR